MESRARTQNNIPGGAWMVILQLTRAEQSRKSYSEPYDAGSDWVLDRGGLFREVDPSYAKALICMQAGGCRD